MTSGQQTQWNVILWDDPVNLMSYVVWVLRSLFGLAAPEATRLMMRVHEDGRAVVDTARREQAEMTAFRLNHHGLRTTLEQA